MLKFVWTVWGICLPSCPDFEVGCVQYIFASFYFVSLKESPFEIRNNINNNINNYNIESTPTVSEKGGTLLYISSELN